MSGLRDNMEILIEQAYERMIEKEQLAIGWDMSVRRKEKPRHGDCTLAAQSERL